MPTGHPPRCLRPTVTAAVRHVLPSVVPAVAAVATVLALAVVASACSLAGATADTGPASRPAELDRAGTTATATATPTTIRPAPDDLGRRASTSGNLRPAAQAIGAGAALVADNEPGTLVAHAIGATVVAHRLPDGRAEPIASFSNPTDLGGPLVFQAVGDVTDGWLEVLLPVRPNGTTGWIPVEIVDLTVNPYRIEVDASAYRLTISRYGVEQLTTTVGIGVGDTPTPYGDFYLIELLRPTDPTGIYGPYAYGLSGFSDTLESFNGGEGIIGIHGTNQPHRLGREVSNGCIRVANPTISEMAEFLPLGTPVSIFRTGAA